MSNSAPPPPPELPPQPLPPAKRRASNAVVIGAAVAVIAAVVGTGIFVVQSRDDDSPRAAASSTPTDEAISAAAEEADPTPTPKAPAADDFTMTLRTTDRQCFGSAGCNLTVEPRLSFEGFSEDLDADAVYEITYEVTGDESGPIIATAELSEKTTLDYTPTTLTTESSGTKVSVKITDVEVQGA